MALPQRAIGLDLGSRRIGVALSAGALATPYEVLERSGDRKLDHRRIEAMVTETEAEVVVVGLPLSLDGSVQRAAKGVLAEIKALSAALSVPVETYDERLSTVTAHQQLAESGVNAQNRRKIVDKVAASIILQAWIDHQNNTLDGP